MMGKQTYLDLNVCTHKFTVIQGTQSCTSIFRLRKVLAEKKKFHTL